MLFDLHIHCQFSPCSVLTLDQVMERALALGLDGVCITDHNTMAARHHIREGVREDGLCVVIGVEYSTPGGDFLLFGPFEHLPLGIPARKLLQQVADEGGVAVACHPLRTSRPVREDLIGSGLCTVVEAVNGRNTADENSRAKALCRLYHRHSCGGSDAHSAKEVGKVLTRFSVPVRSRMELIAALRDGFCSPVTEQDRYDAATTGPLSAEGHGSACSHS